MFKCLIEFSSEATCLGFLMHYFSVILVMVDSESSAVGALSTGYRKACSVCDSDYVVLQIEIDVTR